MAGSGRKVFTAGEVLRAADVNGYLMDQAVQVYAGTAARGSAIGTATSAGMMSYLSDQAKLQLATGTATWVDVYPQSPFSPNYIINSAMDIWQRGTSFTNIASATYTADRWYPTLNGPNATVTRDTSVPNATFNYSYKAVPYSNGTGTEWAFRQVLEQQHIAPLAGQSVAISCWVKSSKTSVKMRFLPTNTTGGTDVTQTFTVTANTWTKISGIFSSFSTVTAWTGAVNAAAGYIDIGLADGQSITTSDSFFFTGVQLEIGSATTFRRNGNSIQGELAACQRYYYRIGSTAAYSNLLLGMQQSTTESHCTVQPPVTMRVTPSVSGTTLAWSDVASFNTTISTIAVSTTSVYSTFNLYSTFAASGAQYRPGFIRSGASSGYIELSAEL